ncbi:nSTAND1 domain-containing NTPase [Nostoc sp.]|uniref:WD40 domain-containing protein n=1 Tax=Nostoc sp. TaxID=1180 RepID=UPI002FF49634
MSIQRQSDEPTDNERSLQQLAWTLQASVEKFKLIWARCNYSALQSRLIKRLGEICQFKIQVLQLKESERTLYTAIREELQNDTQALMIVGWQSLQDLPQMLTSANQVREEFRNHLSLPIVVWISEEIHHTIMEIAPDLESWGTSRSFAIAPTDLSEFIKQLADEYFGGNLSTNNYKILELELEAAQRELRSDDHEAEANLASLLGFVKQTNNKIDIALEYYQKALAIWQQLNNLEKQAKILGEIAYCYYLKALKKLDINHPDWLATRQYTQEYIKFINEANSQDLIASSIIKFGYILGDLKEWEQLKKLAQQALEIHQPNDQPIELAKDYGFLAQVALAQERWSEAKQLAQKAKDILPVISGVEIKDSLRIVSGQSEEPIISNDLSLYNFILAQAQYQLNELRQAIVNLEIARDIGSPLFDLRLYLNILNYLQRLYFEKKEYLKAYETKQQQKSIEQQFGLRAFIGAGQLQSRKQAQLTLTLAETQENIAPEIATSGRSLDVERLIERIGRLDYKLIVVYGQSGVGKSSLVNAGLVPALKNKAIGIQDNLPVVIRVYTNWVEELGRLMQQALHNKSREGDSLALEIETSATVAETATLREQLRENEHHNIRTVLIFDQFEEFFFVYTEPKQRQQFFEFLGECLNILSVKIILSLRVDYLHYLLECNRLSSMAIIGKDILSNNVLYELGNFSPEDTKSIIQRLTQATSFQLEQALIDQLVNDLAGELGEVRPIELQVVGAQLQTENITTVREYQQRGTKEELVKRYLAEVVNDCGVENLQAAELLLYLLTDEKGTRPLKTRIELERDLQALVANKTTGGNNFDLVLQIFVKSGLVILLPENPADRYQLVHDYIALFIRQQQQPKLNELMALLERERQQRKLGEAKLNSFLKRALFGSVAAGVVLAVLALTAWFEGNLAREQRNLATINEIKALTNSSQAYFAISKEKFDALIEALKAEKTLKGAIGVDSETKVKVLTVLQQAVYQVKEYNRFQADENIMVKSIAWSHDGKMLASGAGNGTIKLWNQDGKELRTLKHNNITVNSVSFSPNDKILASAGDDGTIKLWKTVDGKELPWIKGGHGGNVYSIAWSHDGKMLASGDDDGTIKLWNQDGKKLNTLKHNNAVLSVSFSPDSKMLASGGSDGTIKLWRTVDGKELKTFKGKGHNKEVESVSFSPDGKMLASGSYDKTIKLWRILDGKELKTLKGHGDSVRSVVWSPDGKMLASGSIDKTAIIWTVEGEILRTIKNNSWIESAAWNPKGKILAFGSDDGTIQLWNLEDKQLKILVGHSESIRSVNFSPDGKMLASGSDDGTVKLWRTVDGNSLAEIKGGRSSKVYSVAWSPDGKMLASGSEDGTVKLSSMVDGKELGKQKNNNAVRSVSFSSNGKLLAWTSGNTIKLWSLENRKEMPPLNGHEQEIWSVSFSRDSKMLASGSRDGTIKLWNLTNNKVKTFMGHSGEVRSVAWSPDGKLLVSGSTDKTLKLWRLENLWSLENPKERWIGDGGGGFVYSVSFSPDGKMLASASENGTVKLWNFEGKELMTFKGDISGVRSVAWSPDSKLLALGSNDNTVLLWNLEIIDVNIAFKRGCEWLHDYLTNNPRVKAEERHLCDDIETPAS